jgi:adenylate cyclase
VERDLILCLAEHGRMEELRAGRFFSISSKFMIFLGSSVVVLTGVILLLVYKDFRFTIDALTGDHPFEFRWVVQEVVFVFGVLLLGSLLVARQYTRNLKLMFGLQLEAFEAVERGDYETSVPRVSNDEFSLIAEGTNRMIAGLRERERIKRAFGKYMDPAVAEAVLRNEQEAMLGGRTVDVAVLFTDIRDFTPLAERCGPREVVNILNEYFGLVVGAVHAHRGVLDKFVGDAAMAVFGLDGGSGPCDAAAAAGLEIRDGLGDLVGRLRAQGYPELRTGIGIHYGAVVAGNIGSEERLEYTVIGDAVNTAARLESLTKELASSVAVSGEVYDRLLPQAKARLTYVGDCQLKGKSQPLPVYGVVSREDVAA